MLANSPIAPTLPAMDLRRARGFYEGKLGLKVIQATDQDVMYECGAGTMLYVWQREPSQTDHTEAAFKVDNIEKEVAELKGKGVEFESYDMPGIKTDDDSIARIDGYKGAWFKDTEGNILSLTEM
ncbi:MAG: VOC family protein [Actinobacteria bacterium]|nr:VOC family protein [Actinomycetota bacterium]